VFAGTAQAHGAAAPQNPGDVALERGHLVLRHFEAKYPDEPRPRRCLELCEAWAQGSVKMPEAKPAILAAHELH
jgi:hypothetical protein